MSLPEPVSALRVRPHPLRALRGANYRIWVAGAFVSNIGTWVQRTAQDWLVLTQLTRHNAAAVGIVMALQFGPQLLWLPWSGVAADRYDRRRILIATQAAMGALALALGLLTVLGLVRLWQVYLFAFLSGSVAAFDAPVRETFVAELVGDEDLPNAVALNSTSFNGARMVGPAVAGLVIAWIGTGWAFVANGVSFLAVLVALLLLRTDASRRPARAEPGTGGFVEALRYVRGRPDLLSILAMLFLIGTFGLNFPIFISTMTVRVFHSDSRAFGMLSSIMAIGSTCGAFLGVRRDRPRLATALGGTATFGLGCTLAALAPGYWWFAAALLVIGAAALTFLNTTNSLMQLSTDRAMRGRVMALRIGIALGGTLIGAPAVGWIADSAGPRWALGVGAAAGFSATLLGIVVQWRQRGGGGLAARADDAAV